tara:strand:+ start:4837 stop:6129 length:1293 start_codon:yes stop_codon:yes gene_type:complete
MNNNKIFKIRIIGAGLYGCLLAFHLKSKFKKKISIELIENSNDVISNYKSIKLSDVRLNNGFHGIEYPRAKSLIKFLKNDLKFNLIKSYNKRLLCIENHLIDYTYSKFKWPSKLKKNFYFKNKITIEKKDIEKFISKDYLQFLKKIGKRYSNNFEEINHHFIPWFFPSNLKVKSNDEGDDFRNKVRDNKLTPYFFFPKSGVFEDLQKYFKNYLIRLGVKIHFNSSIHFNDNDYYVLKNGKIDKSFKKVEHTFFTASTPLLLKNFESKITSDLLKEKKYLVNKIVRVNCQLDKKFSEIIFANSFLPNLLRASITPNIASNKNSKYLQIEMLFKDDKIDIYDKKLIEILSKILNIKTTSIKIEDSKITRTLFFPKNFHKKKAIKYLDLRLKNFKNFSHRNIFGPPNMSKAWINSYIDANNLYNKLYKNEKPR